MNNYEKIEELLFTKDYEQLNELEKSIVSKIITLEEYCKMRDNLHALNEFFENEINHQFVPKSIEDSIICSFEEHHKLKFDNSNKKVLIRKSVPFWAVAAGFALLIITGGLLMQWKPQTKVRYLTKIDTIYQEKHILDTIFIENNSLESEHDTKSKIARQEYQENMTTKPSSNTIAASVGISVPDPETLRNTKKFPVGTSMSEDAAKEKLTVEIF